MYIEHIRYILGQERRCILDWCDRNGAEPALRERMLAAGLEYYHDHADKELSVLICNAVELLMKDLGLLSDQFDLIVYFHTQQTSLPDARHDIGSLLGGRFGFRCPAFSLSQQNCVSSLVAMQFINALFKSDSTLQRILLIGADAIGIDSMRSVNGGVGFHSDGAVAVALVKNGQKDRWLGAEFLSFAEHYRGIQSSPELAMSLDRQYFLTTYKIITGTLRKSGVSVKDIRWLIPHNVNTTGWKILAQSLKINLSCMFLRNITEKSHVYGCDGFINLSDIQSYQGLQKGDLYLMFSMGYGGFFGSALFCH